MAKYVCDYAQVTSAGEKIVEAANELMQATSTYSTNINQDLSGWTGEAKNTFASQSTSRTDIASSKAKRMSEFGEFVKEVSHQIQELDETLAGITL